MTFTSRNELRLRGGSAEERRAACAVLAASDWGGEPFGPEDKADDVLRRADVCMYQVKAKRRKAAR